MAKKTISEVEMYQKEENRRKQEKVNSTPKPFLMRRIGAGVLDLLFVAILTVLFEFAAYFTVFKPIGYFQAKDEIASIYGESHLFDKNMQKLDYEKDKYEEVLTYYFENDSYVSENGYQDYYVNQKLNSELFEKNSEGTIVLKADVKEEDVKDFYQKQYKSAVDFFNENPTLNAKLTFTFLVFLTTSTISLTIATLIIYLIFPLCRKEGETPSQAICKICLLSKNMDDPVLHRSQIVLRYFILLLFDFYLPIVLYYYGLSTIFLLPVMITIGMMGITKNNCAPHDYASKTVVILKRRGDALSALQQMRENV